MDANIKDVLERKERPAYVKFVREAVEDIPASRQRGIYVAKDIDIAIITPPYSKDIIKFEVGQWFENMRNDVRNERMPAEWEAQYHAKYEAWKKGEELPLDGVPIKGWAVASPAQQETLLRMNVLTVEDLAQMNDEGIRRIGMGGADLKNKAMAWLQAAKDKGPLTQEVSALKSQNAALVRDVASLTEKLEQVLGQINTQRQAAPPAAVPGISAADILDEPPVSGVVPLSDRAILEGQYRAKFGRNAHPSTSTETLRARIAE